jgi:Domain of unknown function (DUF4258)
VIRPVNDTTALAEIQRLAHLYRIRITNHAATRMAERGAAREDVRAALITATAALRQERGGWRCKGRDLAGDDLTVIVDIEADVVVITIF